MVLKRNEVLLTTHHITILDFLFEENGSKKTKSKKGDIHKIFDKKQPHRVNDIIRHLEDLELIKEHGKDLARGKMIEISDYQRVKKILFLFSENSTR